MSSEGNDTGGDEASGEESSRSPQGSNPDPEGSSRDSQDSSRDPRGSDRDPQASAEPPSDAGTSRRSQGRSTGAGESVGRRLDSAQETLLQPGPKAQLLLLVGLFALVGLGIGVMGLLLSSTVGEGGFAAQFVGGLISVAVLVVALLIGAPIAALGGLHVAADLDGGDGELYLTSFVGNAVGYVVMSVIAVVLAGGFPGTDLGGLLLGLVLLSVVAGAVGCGGSALHRRVTGRVVRQ